MHLSKLFLGRIVFVVSLIWGSTAYAQVKTYLNLLESEKTLFVENVGQVLDQNGKPQSDVKFIYSVPGFKLILKKNSFSYEFYSTEKKKAPSSNGYKGKSFEEPPQVFFHINRVDVKLADASASPQIITGQTDGKTAHYYTEYTEENGDGKAKAFEEITYKNILPYTDLVFHAYGGIKYNIILHPGAKLNKLQFIYNGADSLMLNQNTLKLKTMLGEAKEKIPFSYIREDNEAISVNYQLAGNTAGFYLKAPNHYDSTKTLVIDPAVTWATYYGSSSITEGRSITTDVYDNIFICGYTSSTSNIATSGAYQTTQAGLYDAFLAKFSKTGILSWATYYGGSGNDYGFSLAADKYGNIVLAGISGSSAGIATSNGASQKYSGNLDGFISKFNSAGELSWGTYYGGSGLDYCLSVKLDTSSNVYITGLTSSYSGIATPGAVHVYFTGYVDAFLAKYNSNGALQWGTYYGGGDDDEGSNLCIDNKSGAVYMAGSTASGSGIASGGIYQSTIKGGYDCFISKFAPSGTLYWTTYYGGPDDDFTGGLALDFNGNIYISGATLSTSGFASSSAYQKNNKGYTDGFVARFNSSGNRIWSTFFGGGKDDYVLDLATDGVNYLYVTGNTASSSGIASYNGDHTTLSDSNDAFLARFNMNGMFNWGSYYGGGGDDYGYGLAVNHGGYIYMLGSTSSTGMATSGSSQSNFSGYIDAFLSSFKLPEPDIALRKLIIPNQVCAGGSVSPRVALENIGYSWDSNIVVTVAFKGFYPFYVVDTLKKIMYFGDRDTLNFKPQCLLIPNSYSTVAYITSGDRSNDTSSKIPLLISSKPTASFYAWGNCLNSQIMFLNKSYIHEGNISSYQWKFGDGNSSTVTTPTHVYHSRGTYKITLTAVSDFGCSDSVSTFLNVGFDSLAPSFNAATRCLDSTTNFVNTSTGKIVAWYWNFGDGSPLSFQRNPVHKYSHEGDYTAWLKVKSIYGCYDSTSRTVSIISHPKAGFSYQDRCAGGYIDFDNVSSDGSTITDYHWDFGDNNTSTLKNPSHYYPGKGPYSVLLKVRNHYGCTDSIQHSIEVSPLLNADFYMGKISPFQYKFFAEDTLLSNYAWDFGDGSVDSLSGPRVMHEYAGYGSYSVRLSVFNNTCERHEARNISIVNGIKQDKNTRELSLFPNPFHDVIHIRYNLQSNSNVAVYLSDMMGKTVLFIPSEKQQAGEHQVNLPVNVSDLASGPYMLRIISEGISENHILTKF